MSMSHDIVSSFFNYPDSNVMSYHSPCPSAMTADRFFRVDRGQEKLQFITDVHTEDIYILDPEMKPQVIIDC